MNKGRQAVFRDIEAARANLDDTRKQAVLGTLPDLQILLILQCNKVKGI